MSFKQQVVEDLEEGRFSGAEQARLFYGIGGSGERGRFSADSGYFDIS
jgi:hypothetical protein